MPVSVFSAAGHLAERSGWSLSNLKIQKLLYLAHMFHLGRNNGIPLVDRYFEAWDYGPVSPDLYHRLKIYGADPVGNIFRAYPAIAEGTERDILDEAYDMLGHSPAGKLVAATHRRGGAWDRHYVGGIRGITIPNTDILEEYRNMFGHGNQ